VRCHIVLFLLAEQWVKAASTVTPIVTIRAPTASGLPAGSLELLREADEPLKSINLGDNRGDPDHLVSTQSASDDAEVRIAPAIGAPANTAKRAASGGCAIPAVLKARLAPESDLLR
jgi:hypothetical protein